MRLPSPAVRHSYEFVADSGAPVLGQRVVSFRLRAVSVCALHSRLHFEEGNYVVLHLKEKAFEETTGYYVASGTSSL